MPKSCEVEVWVCVDAGGDYAVGTDQESAAERYEECVQQCSSAEGLRYVRVTLTVPLPGVADLRGVVPAAGEAALLAAA